MKELNLFCIDLNQPSLPGFSHFISSWCWQSAGCWLLIDPGPLSSIPHLLQELNRAGIDHLDYILLTHIHIDHAGGTGELLKHYPTAQVICHPEGIRHMIDPARLWQGSLKVLGKTAETYGKIIPIPQEKICYREQIDGTGIRSYKTPGHAQHHCCYLADDLLFAGEVAGVRGEVNQGIYMRPTTPPRFILEVALDSIERMISLAPQRMIFAHYGMVEDAVTHLEIASQQLRLWVRGAVATGNLEAESRVLAFYDWLIARDENYALISQLPADELQREREFLGNSLRGMVEYVASLSEAERRALSA
ncbi:MBL fold metallo-hydrolase [Desulforhopalus sp. IMCC35007]|uniref:MBL fold metallo-hydrolase n=1 Tax=Desulforhopalus sp. IMCC35007 TaxID=2569543 RepID=UPI0010ADE04B|nr:MBL fold metallo-hydrolase [Desulforhopalus sp. IMCC35007]TKB08879.1 MBL fold metallo-hydrolase [Desulforhopalus sp. IMCC35007]